MMRAARKTKGAALVMWCDSENLYSLDEKK